MRDIKFRAWNKKLKSMGSAMPLRILVSDETVIAEDTAWDDLVIMQYTGLKDKNGKEIYEGDIVVSTMLEQKKMSNVVSWNKEYTGFDPFIIPPNFHDDDNYSGKVLSGNYCEVIGNVWENKELIDTNK